MSKEMFISSSPHETKLAVLEDDQLVEVYYERDTDVGLVGGIYKGRVSRVLPGMQSAFVDIGLERDAFLYVSDFFFEDQDDYDKVLEEAEARAVRFTAEQAETGAPATPLAEAGNKEALPQIAAPALAISQIPSGETPAQAPLESPPVKMPAPETGASPEAGAIPAASTTAEAAGEAHERKPFEPRGRRWRHRGRRFGEHRHAEHKFTPREESSAPPAFQVLPGESLAKYGHAASEPPVPEPEEDIAAEQEGVETQSLVETESEGAAETGSLEPTSEEASFSATEQPEIEFPLESTLSDEPYPTPQTVSEETLGPGSETGPVSANAPDLPPVPFTASEAQPVVDPASIVKPSAAQLAEAQAETERPGAEPGLVAPGSGQAFAEPRVVEEDAEPQTPPVESAAVEFATDESCPNALDETGVAWDVPIEERTAEPAFAGDSAEEALAEPFPETAQSSEAIPEPASPPMEVKAPQEPGPAQETTPEAPRAPTEQTYTIAGAPPTTPLRTPTWPERTPSNGLPWPERTSARVAARQQSAGPDLQAAQGGAGNPRADLEGASGDQGCAYYLPHRAARPLPGVHADRRPHRRVAQDLTRRGTPAFEEHHPRKQRLVDRRIHRADCRPGPL